MGMALCLAGAKGLPDSLFLEKNWVSFVFCNLTRTPSALCYPESSDETRFESTRSTMLGLAFFWQYQFGL